MTLCSQTPLIRTLRGAIESARINGVSVNVRAFFPRGQSKLSVIPGGVRINGV